MKFKNKILASLMAVVLAFGVLSLPVFGTHKAKAESATVSSSTLFVKNVNKSYDVTTNNFLTFSDYCDDGSALAKVTKPDGSIESTDRHIQTNEEGVYLNMPGLYALQFSLTDPTGADVFSEVIYIPVSSSNVDGISLDGELNASVKPGTTVEIPMPIDGDWEEDETVDFCVYTPYGEKISAIGDSLTGRWTFTNKTDVLGTYFIEYTKVVTLGKYDKTLYNYQQIEFNPNSTNTVSTTYFEKPTQTATGTVDINISSTGLSGDDQFLYLYKYYNIGRAFVTLADGTKDTTATIVLTILDTETNKFYNATSGEFDKVNSEDAKITLSNSTDDFIITSLGNIENFNTPTGHKLRFYFSATVNGKLVEKTIEKTEKFDSSKIKIQPSVVVPSEITNMVKVDAVNTYDISNVTFSGIKVTVEDGFDLEEILKLILKVELQIRPEGSNTISSESEKDSHGVGIEIVGSTPTTQSFVYYYNKHTTSEEKKLNVDYLITIGEALDSDKKNVITAASYTVYERTESKDNVAPSELTIEKYEPVSNDGSFVIPNATVVDKDNNDNDTTGAAITVTIVGGVYASPTIINMGERLIGLIDGNYTLKYTATDANGNTRSKFIGFKVEDTTLTTVPTIELNSVSYNYGDGHIEVTAVTNATSVTIYGREDGQFSPAVINYVDGKITSFEFDYDLDAEACIAVFSISNSYGTAYKSIHMGSGAALNYIKSVGYTKLTDGYTLITPNKTVEGSVFNKMIWFGGKDFHVEAEEGAYYTITNENVFTFYTAGTYIITSTENVEVDGNMVGITATTTLNIKNELANVSATQPIGHKMVAEKGEKFELNEPTIMNYHGYNLDIVVKDSNGKIVKNSISNTGIKKYFTAPNKDEYTIEYIFTGDGVDKTVDTVQISTGNVAAPSITISGNNKNMLWEGEKIKYNIQSATAIDKNGKVASVSISCFDQYGKKLEVVVEDDKHYVELSQAGFYTVRYTAIDEEGLINIVESVFAIEFPEDDGKDNLSAWEIVGLIFGIMTGACVIALIVIFTIKHNKNKKKFINKAKQDKKQEKKEKIESTSVYTIAESKDGKHWIVKNGNRTIAKVSSKAEAIEKVQQIHKKGELTVKVYNKNGRLIDSI